MTFEEAVKYVIEDEGGYVNHPNDPGGETKFGISKRSYPDLDIANLTEEDAAEIYKRDFWDRNEVEELPPHVRYIYFDMTVNHGPRNAARILQRAAKVKDDGMVGPVTRAAARRVTVYEIGESRWDFFERIMKRNPKLESFRRGWQNRNSKVVARAVNWER